MKNKIISLFMLILHIFSFVSLLIFSVFNFVSYCIYLLYLFIYFLCISRFVYMEHILVLEQKDIASPTRFNHLTQSHKPRNNTVPFKSKLTVCCESRFSIPATPVLPERIYPSKREKSKLIGEKCVLQYYL